MNHTTLSVGTSSFTKAYREALENYILAETGEEALMQAYKLGRQAVSEHCNILDLVATHQNVLLQTIMGNNGDLPMEDLLRRGQDFLSEVIAPFEMMHRGYADTIQQLQDINTTLEQRVEERTNALRKSRQKTADLARLYQILSGINSAIVRLHDRPRLFKEICRIAVMQGGYRAAWINPVAGTDQTSGIILCHHKNGVLSCETSPSPPVSAEITASMNRVIREKRPIVYHHTKDDGPDIDSCSHVLFPLLVDGSPVGVLALFSDKHGAFDKEEMRLLQELAGDLSFALDHIQKEEQLHYLANHDMLTGLANHNLLLERLAMQIQTADRSHSMIALLLIDLVHFSDVNDTYGRHVGDILLRQVGDRLAAATGHRETVARLSADRFAVTLINLTDTHQVAHRLERMIRTSFREAFVINGTEIHITAQVGLALFPSDADTADTLYKNSEIALKRAQSKQEPYLLYNPAMNERIIHSVTMEAKLRKAIDNDELILHYQPKVSSTDGRIIGMEALLRYIDPEKGLVLPSLFIPLLEETGMIIEFGTWVMRQAIEDIRHWRRLNLKPPRVAVNVSPIQLRQKNFLELLEEVLPQNEGDHGLDIEITESAVMDDVDQNIPKLAAIRKMGLDIAVDDFGTGYSSLSYLSQLPIDAVKIDRSFIIDITERPNSLAIVTTIITLAHALELKVVAEGVDQEEQAKLLRLVRCDMIQGDLYCPPLPRDQMSERLRQQNDS